MQHFSRERKEGTEAQFMTALSSGARAELSVPAQRTSGRSRWGALGQSTCSFQVDLGRTESLLVAHQAFIPGDKPNPQLL